MAPLEWDGNTPYAYNNILISKSIYISEITVSFSFPYFKYSLNNYLPGTSI